MGADKVFVKLTLRRTLLRIKLYDFYEFQLQHLFGKMGVMGGDVGSTNQNETWLRLNYVDDHLDTNGIEMEVRWKLLDIGVGFNPRLLKDEKILSALLIFRLRPWDVP